jgi:hypothetical protein
MRALNVGLLVILSVFLLAGVASAAPPEYTSGTNLNIFTAGTEQYNPTVTCSSFGMCVYAVYVTTLFPAVYVYETTDNFQTNTLIGQIVTTFSVSHLTRWFGTPFPIHILYNSDTTTFYIGVNNFLYRYNPATMTQIQLLTTFNQYCDRIIGTIGDDYIVRMNISGASNNNLNLVMYNVVNGSNTIFYTVAGDCSPTGVAGSLKLGYASAFFAYNTDTNKWAVWLNQSEISTFYGDYTSYSFSANLGAFPDEKRSLMQYVPPYIYYRIINTNPNYISRVQTTDFITYSTPETYYTFNLANAETITFSHSSAYSNYITYIYDKTANDSSSGIYTYALPVIPVVISPAALNPANDQYSTINISAILSCPNGYVQSSSNIGSTQFEMQSTCSDNVSLRLLTSGY